MGLEVRGFMGLGVHGLGGFMGLGFRGLGFTRFMGLAFGVYKGFG